MTQANHTRAPQGASGTSRNRRRRQGGGSDWTRPCRRVHRALDASLRLINATLRTVARYERCVHHRPVGTFRNLRGVSAMLRDASTRVRQAERALAVMNECYRREPTDVEIAPEFLSWAAERWQEVAASLQEAEDGVFWLREFVLLGLQTGILTPEPPARRRPRIILAPRPAPVRAFLRLRQPRVVDRITPILRRRRRIPRPASVRVPRRSLLGRAPPLSSISLL
jgi:hypothetical protein